MSDNTDEFIDVLAKAGVRSVNDANVVMDRQLNIIVELKEVALVLERVVQRQDRADAKLDEIASTLHDNDKRISSVEKDETPKGVGANKRAIEQLSKEFATFRTQVLTSAAALSVLWLVLGDEFKALISTVVGG